MHFVFKEHHAPTPMQSVVTLYTQSYKLHSKG